MSLHPLKLPWWWREAFLEVLRDCPRPFIAQAHSSGPEHCAITICNPRQPFQAVQLEFHCSLWANGKPSRAWAFEVSGAIEDAVNRLREGHDQVQHIQAHMLTLDAARADRKELEP